MTRMFNGPHFEANSDDHVGIQLSETGAEDFCRYLMVFLPRHVNFLVFLLIDLGAIGDSSKTWDCQSYWWCGSGLALVVHLRHQ